MRVVSPDQDSCLLEPVRAVPSGNERHHRDEAGAIGQQEVPDILHGARIAAQPGPQASHPCRQPFPPDTSELPTVPDMAWQRLQERMTGGFIALDQRTLHIRNSTESKTRLPAR